MADDIKSTLEAAGAVGEQVGIVGDAHHGDAQRSKVESKPAVVKREERGVDVHLEVPTGPDVALPLCSLIFLLILSFNFI